MNAQLSRAALLCLCALAAPSPASAIIDGEPVGDETRYDAIGALGFAARVGLEGPLPAPDDTWHCTATLIGPSLALTARHCLFAGGAPVDPTTLALVFRRNPDGSLGVTDPSAADRGLSSFHRVRASEMRVPDTGANDVALVELAEPVTHIAPLSLAIHGTMLAEGSPIRVAGWGREGPTSSDPQTGLRTCDTTTVGSWTDYYVTFTGPSATSCGPASHDSGAPILVRSVDDEERIVGIVNASIAADRLVSAAALPQLDALTHTPWSGVDLSVDGHSHALRYFRVGEEIELEITVRNGGSAPAADVTAEISVVGLGPEPERQTLHSQPIGDVGADGAVTQTIRFRPPHDTSQSMHRLAVRVSSAGDVLASNDEYVPPQQEARFYAVPRVLVYRDLYFAFLHQESSVVGALAVFERGDGTVAALVTGPGRAVALEHSALGGDRTLVLDAFGADGAPLALGLTLPIHPVGDRQTGSEPIRVVPAVVSGNTSRDDRFAGVFYSGSANHGAGRYVGSFLDGAREPISALALPSRNVVLVIPDLAAPNGSYLLAGPEGEQFEWRVSSSVASSLAARATQRFDPDRDQYVAEGTVTTPEGVERPFLLVREASALAEGDPCHDDAECVAAGALRCAPDVWRCTDEPPTAVEEDAGAPSGSDGGVPPLPQRDAGAASPVSGGGCGCRAAGRSGAPATALVAGLALVALLRRRR